VTVFLVWAGRLGEGGLEQVKRHPWFDGLQWEGLHAGQAESPLRPWVSPASATDMMCVTVRQRAHGAVVVCRQAERRHIEVVQSRGQVERAWGDLQREFSGDQALWKGF
jgi:hypothetical protein